MAIADKNEESNQSNGTQYLLMGLTTDDKIEFIKKSSLLKDSNIFIGDTGATFDSTNYDIELVDVHQAKETDNIVDVLGKAIYGSILGDMPCTVCDKNGQELKDIMIKNIMHLLKSGYNLFSLTKRLEDGWALGGNADALWIKKKSIK